jgi:hypothetical protein
MNLPKLAPSTSGSKEFFEGDRDAGNRRGGAGTGVPACAEFNLLLLLFAVVFVVVNVRNQPTPSLLLFVVLPTSDGLLFLVAIRLCDGSLLLSVGVRDSRLLAHQPFHITTFLLFLVLRFSCCYRAVFLLLRP